LSGVCHLDPDFSQLSYGDGSRAQRIREYVEPGSFILFWAALRYFDGPKRGQLICSIIGFYTVSCVLHPQDIDALHAHRNAHNRRSAPADDNIVVFADPRKSGRLRRHIPIGDNQQDGHQRVGGDTLAARRGVCKMDGELLKNGYIQLSGSPPIFKKDPQRFLAWFSSQQPEFVHANNVV
jgi:Nucleotide modification associated domain 3